MAKGPSREERREYANAGKDQYYDNQENVLFPQAQADIYAQVSQRGQALDQWSFQQQQAKDQYKDQVKLQTETYKNQIEAFEKSDDIYKQNQKYIQGAYDSKVGEANAQLEETVRAGYFDLKGKERQFNRDQYKSQNEVDRLDIGIDQKLIQQQKLGKQLNISAKQSDARSTYLKQQLANNQTGYSDQRKLLNQQLANNQTQFQTRQALLNQQKLNNSKSYESQQQLIDKRIDQNVTNKDSEIAYLDKKIKGVTDSASDQRSIAKQDKTRQQRDRKLELEQLEAQKTYLTQQRDIALEEKNSRDSQIDLNYQEKMNNGMYEQLTNKIQAIVDQGTIASSGKRGRTVANNLNSVIATAGFNGARLTEGMNTLGLVRDVQKDESTTAYDKLIGGITNQEADNKARTNRNTDRKKEINSAFTLKKAMINADRDSKKDDLKYRKKTSEANFKDTKWNLKNAKEQSTLDSGNRKAALEAELDNNKLQKKQTNQQLKFNQSENLLNKKRTAQQLKFEKKNANLAAKEERLNLRTQKKLINKDIDSAAKQQDLIAAELGFTAEQLEMTREQLGESILSANQQNNRTKNDLKRMAKQENLSAFYQRMAKPKFNALPKPPYEVDMPKFAPIVKMASPGEFLSASDSGYLNATKPASGPSGLSQVLQIGGMALGAIAAPFTGGASVMGMSMGAGTAGALAGGGQLLGGLGKSGLFD